MMKTALLIIVAALVITGAVGVAAERTEAAQAHSIQGPNGAVSFPLAGSGLQDLDDGKTWVITLTDIDTSGIKSDSAAYLLRLRSTPAGRDMAIQVSHDLFGPGAHYVMSFDQQWWVRKSHSFGPGDITGTFDLRVVMRQLESGHWAVAPFYRTGSSQWTPFSSSPGGWVSHKTFDMPLVELVVDMDGARGDVLKFSTPTVESISTIYASTGCDNAVLGHEVIANAFCGINAFPMSPLPISVPQESSATSTPARILVPTAVPVNPPSPKPQLEGREHQALGLITPAEGGTVTALDGGVTVSVRPGSVDDWQGLSVIRRAKVNLPPIGDGWFSFGSRAYEILFTDADGYPLNNIFSLKRAATLTFNYSDLDAELSAYGPHSLRIYRYDPDQGWMKMDTVVDPINKTLTVRTMQFSDFVIGLAVVPASSADPGPGHTPGPAVSSPTRTPTATPNPGSGGSGGTGPNPGSGGSGGTGGGSVQAPTATPVPASTAPSGAATGTPVVQPTPTATQPPLIAGSPPPAGGGGLGWIGTAMWIAAGIVLAALLTQGALMARRMITARQA